MMILFISLIPFRLFPVHFSIAAISGHQFLMESVLDNLPVLENLSKHDLFLEIIIRFFNKKTR